MKTYKRNNEIETASIGEELGMLNVNDGKYFILDSIGKDVWHILEHEKNMDEIVRELMSIYDVSDTECRSDLNDLLNDMKQKTIILEV